MTDRPPRAQPPRFSSQAPPATSSNTQDFPRPPPVPYKTSAAVSFSEPDRLPTSPTGEVAHGSKYGSQPGHDQYNALSYDGGESPNVGGFDEANVRRKKSLVRPDRERIDPNHRQWYYRNHAAQMENEHAGRVGVIPSSAYTTLHSSGGSRFVLSVMRARLLTNSHRILSCFLSHGKRSAAPITTSRKIVTQPRRRRSRDWRISAAPKGHVEAEATFNGNHRFDRAGEGPTLFWFHSWPT